MRMPWYKPINTYTDIMTSVYVRVVSPVYSCSILSGDFQLKLQSVVSYSFFCDLLASKAVNFTARMQKRRP